MNSALRLLPDLEEAIRRLPGIRAASVVTGPDAVPTEVHVLATGSKAPKQVVRDVQSLAMARYDIDLDHRIVSVVQFAEADASPGTTLGVVPERAAGAQPEPEPEPEPEAESGQRPVMAAITMRTSGTEAEATVTVTVVDEPYEGKVTGAGTAANRPKLVARATLEAVAELLGTPADVEHAAIVSAGHRSIAVCLISLLVPRVGEQLVTGSALVRGDEADAVARSVLDALNRRLTG